MKRKLNIEGLKKTCTLAAVVLCLFFSFTAVSAKAVALKEEPSKISVLQAAVDGESLVSAGPVVPAACTGKNNSHPGQGFKDKGTVHAYLHALSAKSFFTFYKTQSPTSLQYPVRLHLALRVLLI